MIFVCAGARDVAHGREAERVPDLRQSLPGTGQLFQAPQDPHARVQRRGPGVGSGGLPAQRAGSHGPNGSGANGGRSGRFRHR